MAPEANHHDSEKTPVGFEEVFASIDASVLKERVEKITALLDRARTPEEADEAFEESFNVLSRAEQVELGLALEKTYLDFSNLQERIEDNKSYKKAFKDYFVADDAENTYRNSSYYRELAIAREQTETQIRFNVAELCGASASPLTVAFAAAAKALSDADYNTHEVLYAPDRAVIVQIALDKGIIKANPLRNRQAPVPSSGK